MFSLRSRNNSQGQSTIGMAIKYHEPNVMLNPINVPTTMNSSMGSKARIVPAHSPMTGRPKNTSCHDSFCAFIGIPLATGTAMRRASPFNLLKKCASTRIILCTASMPALKFTLAPICWHVWTFAENWNEA
jgi:hypothetical protein